MLCDNLNIESNNKSGYHVFIHIDIKNII